MAYGRFAGGVSGFTVRPSAESAMSVARRLCFVSSRLALMTHQIAA
jgi:hypothetical protein